MGPSIHLDISVEQRPRPLATPMETVHTGFEAGAAGPIGLA